MLGVWSLELVSRLKPTQTSVIEVSAAYHQSHITAIMVAQKKVVHKKPAVNDKPVGIVRKEPDASSVKKKPAALNKKPATGQIVEYYETIATLHEPDDRVTKEVPLMFMELGATVARLAGELWSGYTVIGGQGSLGQEEGCLGERQWTISQPDAPCANCIGTETVDQQSYGGFISAKVTSIVCGTRFKATKVDPEIDSDAELQHDAPWETVVTMKGDVICRFKIKSFYQDDEPEEFVHLMRPMLPSTVTILKFSGVMWNSLEEESLLDTLGHFRQILDEMTTRPY